MIGIFDSGCGGLSVLKKLRARLPSSDVVYFGDTKNAPYGLKSREELFVLTGNALSLLSQEGATSIVSACNSVSTSLALSLFDTVSVSPERLIEMVGPTVQEFRDSPARIGLVATVATIDSCIYQNAFRILGKEIDTIPIPALAGAIETGTSQEEIDRIVAEALQGKESSFDVLILACTHYPLVAESFSRVVGAKTIVFDPAVAVADRVYEKWWPREVGDGKLRFILSKDSEVFRGFVERLFPDGDYSIEVVE